MKKISKFYDAIIALQTPKQELQKQLDSISSEIESLTLAQRILLKQGENDYIICPRCDGAGQYERRSCAEDDYDMKPCPLCFGQRTVSLKEALKEKGIEIKEK